MTSYAEKIESYLAGDLTDGRVINSLKNRGYIDKDGNVTNFGYRETGVFRNMPQLSKIYKDFNDTDAVDVDETIFDMDDKVVCTNNFIFSAKKIKDIYNDYVDRINKKITDKWDWSYEFCDPAYKAQTDAYVIRSTKDNFFHGDFYYTLDMLDSIAKVLESGSLELWLTTSHKFSFTDTDFETTILEIDSDKTETTNVVLRVYTEVNY